MARDIIDELTRRIKGNGRETAGNPLPAGEKQGTMGNEEAVGKPLPAGEKQGTIGNEKAAGNPLPAGEMRGERYD